MLQTNLKFLVFPIFLILFPLVWYQVTSHNRSFGSCRWCQRLSYRYMDKYGTRRGKERKTKGISRLSDYNAGKNWDLDFVDAFTICIYKNQHQQSMGLVFFLSGAIEQPHANCPPAWKTHKDDNIWVILYTSHGLACSRTFQWVLTPEHVQESWPFTALWPKNYF